MIQWIIGIYLGIKNKRTRKILEENKEEYARAENVIRHYNSLQLSTRFLDPSERMEVTTAEYEKAKAIKQSIDKKIDIMPTYNWMV